MRNHLLRLRSRIEDNQILEAKEENELKSLERGETLMSWRKGSSTTPTGSVTHYASSRMDSVICKTLLKPASSKLST